MAMVSRRTLVSSSQMANDMLLTIHLRAQLIAVLHLGCRLSTMAGLIEKTNFQGLCPGQDLNPGAIPTSGLVEIKVPLQQ